MSESATPTPTEPPPHRRRSSPPLPQIVDSLALPANPAPRGIHPASSVFPIIRPMGRGSRIGSDRIAPRLRPRCVNAIHDPHPSSPRRSPTAATRLPSPYTRARSTDRLPLLHELHLSPLLRRLPGIPRGDIESLLRRRSRGRNRRRLRREAQVPKDPPHDRRIGEECDDHHRSRTPGTLQRIDVQDPQEQLRPRDSTATGGGR